MTLDGLLLFIAISVSIMSISLIGLCAFMWHIWKHIEEEKIG